MNKSLEVKSIERDMLDNDSFNEFHILCVNDEMCRDR